MNAPSRTSRLRIGAWVVDPATNELVRGGTTVRIEPKAMDLLVLLAGRAGETVGREELLARVWAGTIVGDEALTQSVTKLRRALGDDPRSPAYIETISKRGYRLVAPVRPVGGVRPAVWAAAAILLVSVLGALAAWLATGANPHPGAARLAAAPARSPEADADFRRAQALFLVRGPEENSEARAWYREALARDPQFARAYAGLAMTHAMDRRLRPADGGEAALRRAIELAEGARLIDPDNTRVLWALGFVLAQARQHERAIAALQRAVELDPAFADAYALLGGIYTYMGEPARTIPLLRTAMRLRPSAGHLYFLLLGRAYLFQDDPEQALINLRAAAVRNPADIETHVYLAAASIAAGDPSTAAWEAEEIRALDPDFSLARWLDSYPLRSARHRDALVSLAGRAGL